MVKLIWGRLIYFYTFYKHKKAWRHINRHNLTIAINSFPINKVEVGNYTYGDLFVISYGEDNQGLKIGNFVSIASGVKFLLGGNHYYKRFTTYPMLSKFENSNLTETWSKGKIIIEDDVWIGTEAFIMPGVTIGRGSIIGARAVVSRDVAPYTIVAGNPARYLKDRFDNEHIEQHKLINFGELSPKQLLKNVQLYRQESDFDAIVNYLNKYKNDLDL